MTQVNRQWRVAARPEGLLKDSDFKWSEEPVTEPGDGEVLVRNIYLSLDPTNRIWMNGTETYMAPLRIGDVMRGGTLGVVEKSRHGDFHEGDLVQGLLGWQEYAVSKGPGLTKLPKGQPIPLTAYFGLFGHIGITAYFGLLDIGKSKAGETLVVSTAAGAVGSLVGQIGKIKGCRVVGLTGSDAKCHWLTSELGFDAAVNYKTEPVLESLHKHCPKGIDVYFDNVGGEILDAALALINQRARIALCGMISMYNADTPVEGPKNLANLLMKRARIEGFIVIDYMDRAMEAMADLGKWYAMGKLKYRVDVVEGLKNAPSAVNKLFDGSNQGKLIVKISEEPK